MNLHPQPSDPLSDRRFASAVRVLTQIIHLHEGEELFRELAANLNYFCQTSYCSILRLDPASPYLASTLVFMHEGQSLESVERNVLGTPCEGVYRGDFQYYERDIPKLFPVATWLGEIGVDAYMGIPLAAKNGRILGIIALMNGTPFADPELAESLLRIVASRVAAEIERFDIERALRAERARFRGVFEHASDAIFLHDIDGHIVDVNRQACINLGYERSELIGALPVLYDPAAAIPGETQKVLDRLEAGESFTLEAVHRRKNGELFPVELRLRSYLQEGRRYCVVIVIDLEKRRNEASARKKLELALEHQKSIFEQIARGESGQAILEEIVRYVEENIPVCRCSIQILKQDRLHFGAGARIPAGYSAAIEGVQIGPEVGSCGSAAFHGRTVIARDVETDPRWTRFRELARQYGFFRSCWSAPILAGKVSGAEGKFGQVLGTFAIYGEAVSEPTAEEMEVVHTAAYLAGIAIERTRMEEALRDSESRLATMIENSPGVAIQWYDSEGRVVLWNRASEEIFGFRAAEALGKKIDELIYTPEELAAFIEACRTIQRTGGSIGPNEFTFRRRDGSSGVCLCTIFQIPGRDGQERYVCMDVDITERKKTEEAVHRSREMLQLILDNIPQGVVWKDRQSRYVGVNAAVRRAMGLGDQDPTGKDDGDFDTFTREQIEYFMAKDREVMERNEPQYQIVESMRVADGRTIWLNTNKIPLHDAQGQVNGVLVTWEDFTEKRRAQEELQLSFAWLRRAQSMAKLGAWIYDCQAERFDSPEGGHRILKLGPGLRKAHDFFRLVHPDDLEKTRLAWEAALQGDVFNVEHRMYVHKELRWFAVRAEPERDEAGKVVRLVGVTQDITDRKRLEEQLLQAQKYEGLGILAGGIAHEFNNILTTVLGSAELGAMQSPAAGPAAETFAEIGKAARRAANLTKQMLAYSGRGQMTVAPVDLAAVIQDATPLWRSMVGGKATLELKLEPASVMGDAVQLRQVGLQFVSNAVEAIGLSPGQITIRTGGVELVESELSGPFSIPPRSAGAYAFLEVTDTGCGMTPDVAAKIFDPFFTTKFAGRGLGLAAVMGIVKRHQGGVQLKTAPRQGTTIRLLIPSSSSPASAGGLSGGLAAAASSRGILLVEDEPAVREFLGQLLLGAGFQVIVAKDGLEAVEIAERQPGEIQVVLLDLIMPRLDGWGAFDKLREMLPAAPIILMSGFDESTSLESLPQKSLAAGFLQKPFRPSQLFAAIKQALASGRQERPRSSHP